VTAPGGRVAFATSEECIDLDDGWPHLRDALVALDLCPSVVLWDDPGVAWDTYDIVVAIYTWGYVVRRAQFLAWVDRVASVTRLVNPAPVLHWNSDKTYLADLAADGIPIVPTTWVPPGAPWCPPAQDYVIKPSVASGGIGAARYVTQALEVAERHVHALHDGGFTVMVQPYQAAVDSAGETALIFLDGAFTHAVGKAPLLRADVGVTDRLWEQQVITAVAPTQAQRAAADDVMRVVVDHFGPIGYGRVDLVDGSDGHPLVLELELVEPSLFLAQAPGAAGLFAASLHHRR
jgi:hypothetical protein